MSILKIKNEENNWIDLPSFEPAEFLVEDTLTSTSPTNALSANQGKVLNEKFDDYLLTSNQYPRQDAISVTFSTDTTVQMPSTQWTSVILPFNYVMANSNNSLYTLQSDGSIRVRDTGYYLVCGTANCDHAGNWSLVAFQAVINDTKTDGMENCWLAPFVVYKNSGDSIALYARCETANASMRFRAHRSYLTVIKIA